METETRSPKVTRAGDVTDRTAQTHGMHRQVGVDQASVGARQLWLGRVQAAPQSRSAPHHHGKADTGSHVLSGQVRVYFGDDYKEFVEAGPGDFLYIPAFVPHIEANEGDEVVDTIVVRAPDNIVVNL